MELMLLPLVVLLVVVYGMESNNLQRSQKFRALHAGRKIIGSVGAALNMDYPIMCSRRCTTDGSCTGYKYGNQICTLIYRNTTESTGLEFQSDTDGHVYTKDQCEPNPCESSGSCHQQLDTFKCSCVMGFTGTNCETNIDDCPATNPCLNGGTCVDGINSYTCGCPTGMTGVICETNINECESAPCQNGGSCVDRDGFFNCTCSGVFFGIICDVTPVYIEPFDILDAMTLYRGAQLLPSGKWYKAVVLNNTLNQYADLGVPVAPCLPLPETCRTDATGGGSVAFWIYFIGTPVNFDGYLTSSASTPSSGFHFLYMDGMFRCELYATTEDAKVAVTMPAAGTWIHFVLTWKSPVLVLYMDGMDADRATATESSRGSGDGRVVVGRAYTDTDVYYSSMKMDHLGFLNGAVTANDAHRIYSW